MTEAIEFIDGASNKLRAVALFPDTAPDELFVYLVDPALIVQWWPETAEIDPRPGGSYAFRWPSQNWTLFGDIVEYEPGQKLSYTWQWEHEPDLPQRLVEIELEPDGDGSRLRITQGTYSDSEVDQTDRQSHIDGWAFFLGRLQELLG